VVKPLAAGLEAVLDAVAAGLEVDAVGAGLPPLRSTSPE